MLLLELVEDIAEQLLGRAISVVFTVYGCPPGDLAYGSLFPLQAGVQRFDQRASGIIQKDAVRSAGEKAKSHLVEKGEIFGFRQEDAGGFAEFCRGPRSLLDGIDECGMAKLSEYS
jgi:hypothetical protein